MIVLLLDSDGGKVLLLYQQPVQLRRTTAAVAAKSFPADKRSSRIAGGN